MLTKDKMIFLSFFVFQLRVRLSWLKLVLYFLNSEHKIVIFYEQKLIRINGHETPAIKFKFNNYLIYFNKYVYNNMNIGNQSIGVLITARKRKQKVDQNAKQCG